MTARIWFKPAGRNVIVDFQELGCDDSGAWGLVEDTVWMRTPTADALELLYLSRAEYEHAMRKLPAPEVGLAIGHRRKTFWQRLTQRSTGLVQEAIWAAIDLTDNREADLRLRERVLSVHARFIDCDRLRAQPPRQWLEDLLEDDVRLVAELDSPSMKAVARQDPEGKERALRRRFVKELAAFLPPEEGETGFAWPYFEAKRVYAVGPVSASLQGGHPGEDGPRRRWRDSVLMVVHDREAARLRKSGHQLRPVYGTEGELLAASYLLTPAQLDLEVSERIAAPNFDHRLQTERIGQASARAAARMLSDDQPKLAAVLAKQVKEESRGLGTWSRRPGQERGAATALAALADAASLANLLSTWLMRAKQLQLAERQSALAKALEEAARDSAKEP